MTGFPALTVSGGCSHMRGADPAGKLGLAQVSHQLETERHCFYVITRVTARFGLTTYKKSQKV